MAISFPVLDGRHELPEHAHRIVCIFPESDTMPGPQRFSLQADRWDREMSQSASTQQAQQPSQHTHDLVST